MNITRKLLLIITFSGILALVFLSAFDYFILQNSTFNQAQLWSLFIIITIISFVTYTAIHYYVTAPLKKLAKFANAINMRNLQNLRIDVQSADELGDLALQLNQMLDFLQENNVKIVRALEEAEHSTALSKAKTDFLANMSHEIRTPMNGVMGMLQLLLYTDLTEPQKKYVNTCINSGEALLKILSDILDHAKIESGKITFETLQFSMQELLNELAGIYAIQCAGKGIVYEMRIAACIPVLVGDPLRIKQIFNNLVNNAIKFTPEGGKISISVAIKEKLNNDLILECQVQDNGIGIPPEYQPKIFHKYSQADESTTRQYGGTGLGLSICKHLVELMGGQIHVSSEKDQGASFTFTLKLPFINNAELEIHETVQAQNVLKKNADILVVEDNPSNQIVISEMLKLLGCSMKIVDSGSEALVAVKEKPYDFILMDCQMPQMDGFETTELIRHLESENQKKRNVIIALTANVLPKTRERCFDVGMDDVLTKPLQYQDLVAMLNKHM